MKRWILPLFVVVLAVAACSGGTSGGSAPPTTTSTTKATGAATAEKPREPKWLVYASRDGGRTVVTRRPLGPGEPEVLSTYADTGSDAPDVAVSADGRLVGYVTGGLELRVRELATGRERLLVSGEPREPPPNVGAAPPRWSLDGMNYLTTEEQAECPECGILAIGDIVFSPSGNWLAFGQHYYEGGNWGFVERATGRYETSGDAAGDLFWMDEDEIVTVGAFYGEDAGIHRAGLAELPSSRKVATGRGEHRSLFGSLSPAGDRIAVLFDQPPDPAGTRSRAGVLSVEGGDLSELDADGQKLSTGFTDDGTAVWIEGGGRFAVILSEGRDPVPLPDDLSNFSRISPVGPGGVGFSGEARDGAERRYLVVDVGEGNVVWESQAFDAGTTFAGLTP